MMPDPQDTAMQPLPWLYTVQSNGQSLATFLGDVIIEGEFNQSTFAPVYYPEDFGPDPDSLARAVAYVASLGGGIIQLGHGFYNLSVPFMTTGSQIWIRGQGVATSIIQGDFSTGDIFCVGDGVANPTYWLFTDVGFQSTVAMPSTAAALRWRNGHCIRAQRVGFYTNVGIGVAMAGGPQQFEYTLTDFEINNPIYGIVVGPGGLAPQDIWVERGVIYGASTGGILVGSVSGAVFAKIDIGSGAGYGFGVNAALGNVEAVWCDKVECDTMSGNGWTLITAGGFSVTEFNSTDCWCSDCGTTGTVDGVSVNGFGAGNFSDITFTNLTCHGNAGHGMTLTFCDLVQLNHCKFANNSNGTPGVHNGLNVSTGTTNLQVRGGFSRPGGYFGGANSQAYGVGLVAGLSGYTIDGINVQGNLTGGINDLSNDPTGIITNCQGYKTTARGTTAIAIGQNTATFAHGLPFTPALGDVQVCAVSSMLASGVTELWASATSATTVTVNCTPITAGATLTVAVMIRSKGA
jgi:hypothetical protein